MKEPTIEEIKELVTLFLINNNTHTMKEPTLKEIKELVTFTRDSTGILQVCDVRGDVWGDVEGNVLSNVWGNVGGNVKGVTN